MSAVELVGMIGHSFLIAGIIFAVCHWIGNHPPGGKH